SERQRNTRDASSVRRTIQTVRMYIGQHRVRQEKPYRSAHGQQLADLRGGNRQRVLPDETDLSARPGQRQRVTHAACCQQVAQRLRRLAVGIRPLQHQQVTVIEQFLPTVPARQATEGIPAQQQEHLVIRRQLRTQRLQRIDRVRGLVAPQLAVIDAQRRLVRYRQ